MAIAKDLYFIIYAAPNNGPYEVINFLNKNKKIRDVKFLYGGSVNSQNFFEIKNKCKVNGALIGGASLLEKEITKILKGDF